MNRFRLSSSYACKLEELGLSPVAVLGRAGLPLSLFNQDKTLVTTEEFFRVLPLLARRVTIREWD